MPLLAVPESPGTASMPKATMDLHPYMLPSTRILSARNQYSHWQPSSSSQIKTKRRKSLLSNMKSSRDQKYQGVHLYHLGVLETAGKELRILEQHVAVAPHHKRAMSLVMQIVFLARRKDADLEVIGELGTKKTMRRKSLQDLLGTVGTKLSLARRLVYSEDTISQSETPQEAMTETQGISPLVLPEPALPLLRAHNSVFGSLCHFSKDSTSHEVPNSRENVETPRNSECAPTDRPRLRVKPSLRILNGAVQESNMNDRSKPPQLPCMSQELKHVSPSTSPERLSPAVPTDFLRDVSPQLLPRVR